MAYHGDPTLTSSSVSTLTEGSTPILPLSQTLELPSTTSSSSLQFPSTPQHRVFKRNTITEQNRINYPGSYSSASTQQRSAVQIRSLGTVSVETDYKPPTNYQGRTYTVRSIDGEIRQQQLNQIRAKANVPYKDIKNINRLAPQSPMPSLPNEIDLTRANPNTPLTVNSAIGPVQEPRDAPTYEGLSQLRPDSQLTEHYPRNEGAILPYLSAAAMTFGRKRYLAYAFFAAFAYTLISWENYPVTDPMPDGMTMYNHAKISAERTWESIVNNTAGLANVLVRISEKQYWEIYSGVTQVMTFVYYQQAMTDSFEILTSMVFRDSYGQRTGFEYGKVLRLTGYTADAVRRFWHVPMQ